MINFKAMDMDYKCLGTGSPKAVRTAMGQMACFLTGYNVGNTIS